jgi:hypothetical protein
LQRRLQHLRRLRAEAASGGGSGFDAAGVPLARQVMGVSC